MKLEIAETIDLVEDVTLRLILEKRYLSFLPWNRIALDLNYTERWLQRLHNSALEQVQWILDEREEQGMTVTG